MQIFELWAKLGMKTDDFDSKIASSKEKASGLSGAFSKFGSIASKAFIAAEGAVTAFLGTSIKTGMNFDSAMSQVAATMGESVENIKDLRDFAMEMGRTTAFSASEAAGAMNILAMAGYSAEQNMATLPAVLNMAAAGGLSIADAADYATGIMAGFGLGMDQAGSVANKLSMIAKSAKGDVASFGEGLSTVAGMAKTTGQNLDDMTVALGILGNNNYSASEAGNALSRTLRNLYQPSDSAAKMLKQIGVSAYDAQGNAKPLQQVLQELNGRLSGLDAQSKNQVLSKIFDAATLKSVPALMNNAGAAWDDLAAKVASADALGTASDMAETQLNNLQGAMTLFRSAVEGAQIAISDALTPSLIEFVRLGSQAVSDLTGAFQKGGVDGFFEKFTEVFGNLSNVILGKIPEFATIGVKLLASIATGLGSAMPSLINALSDVLSLAFTGAISGIPKIIRGASEITLSVSEFIRTFGESLVNGIPDAVAQIMPFINALVENIKLNSTMLIDAGIDFVRNLMTGIQNSVPTLLTYVPQMIENILGTFYENYPKILNIGSEMISNIAQGLVQGIPLLLETVLPMVADYTGTLADNAGHFIDAGLQLLLSLVQGIMNGLPALIENVPTIITNFANVINENMPKVLATGVQILWTLITGIISAVPSLIANMGKIMLMVIDVVQAINWLGLGHKILEFIVNGIVEIGFTLPSTLKNLAQNAWDFVKGIDWGGLGRGIIDGIVEGIRNFGGSIASTLKNMATNAFNAAKRLLKIGSPSKVFRDGIGKWIPKGVAVGIEANSDSVKEAMSDLSDLTVDAYDPMIDASAISSAEPSSSNIYGGVVININASDYDGDPIELGKKIKKILMGDMSREEAVFGV